MAQLAHVDGVMIGRAAYQDSWLVARLDARLFGGTPATEAEVLAEFERYVARELAERHSAANDDAAPARHA